MKNGSLSDPASELADLPKGPVARTRLHVRRLRQEASDLITKAASLREYVVHNMVTAERDEIEAAEQMRAVEELELRLAADVDAAKQSDSQVARAV